MKMTLANIRKKANQANDTFFDNKIDVDAITFSINNRFKRTLGQCEYNRASESIKIKLAGCLSNLDGNYWMKTLVHEMVHAFQYTVYGYADHGPTFKRLATLIRRVEPSIEITRLANVDSAKLFPDKKVSDQYLIVKGTQCWALRRMDRDRLRYLKDFGYKVFRNTGKPVNMRHCKNAITLKTVKYAYSLSAINRSMPLRKEL